MKRRTFLGGALTATGVGSFGAQSATAQAVAEPLVWPVVTKLPPEIRSFAGHTDTVPDIVGRIGTPPSLVIFTEGNHLMVLLSDDIIGAFPSWAKSQPQYAVLDLDNIKETHSEFVSSLMSRAAGRGSRCRRLLANSKLAPGTVQLSMI